MQPETGTANRAIAIRPRQGDRRLVLDQRPRLCARTSDDNDRWASAGLDHGPTRMCCRISGGKSIGRAAPAPIAAATGRSPRSFRNRAIHQRCDPRSRPARGLSFHRGIQRRAGGRLCRSQSTIKDGRRCSAAVAYLHPALARGADITVETEALARRIVFEGQRAVGIEYEQRGEIKIARAGREVILCRRRNRLAAIADALGYRRCRRASRPRYRCKLE